MGAGVVHWLGVGESTVGSSAGCAVRLDIDGSSARIHRVRRPRDRGERHARGRRSDRSRRRSSRSRCPLARGRDAARRSVHVLEVRSASLPDAALEPSDDGVGLDYNRPPRLLPAERETTFVLPTEPKAPRGRGIPVIAMLAPSSSPGPSCSSRQSRYGLFALMSPILLIGNWLSCAARARRTIGRR